MQRPPVCKYKKKKNNKYDPRGKDYLGKMDPGYTATEIHHFKMPFKMTYTCKCTRSSYIKVITVVYMVKDTRDLQHSSKGRQD